MLLVPTYVAPSRIAGVGLFACTPIPRGAVVWEFHPAVDWRIMPDELELFPEPYRSRMRHYVYRESSGVYVLCGDNAKFMNHSDDPNCDDSGEVWTVAKRAIRAGEEMTCDYRLFDTDVTVGGITFGRDGSLDGPADISPPPDRGQRA